MSKIPSIISSAQSRLIIYRLFKDKLELSLKDFLLGLNIDIKDLSSSDIIELQRAFSFIEKTTEQGLQKQFLKLTGQNIWLGIKATHLLEEFLKEHALLIKSLQQEHLDKLKLILQRSIRQGLLQKDIVKELQSATSICKRRAKLIAKNAPLQYSGALTKRHQQSAGITHYKWQTSHDERVRDSHKARNGKTYAWSEPGPHPRAEVNCRCDAVPIIK